MKKLWSITTTTRNPYRLREQLRVFNDNFVGHEWTKENQANFQISLIQHRLYGYSEDKGFSKQFLNDLSPEHQRIFTDFEHKLTFVEAREIFISKNYKDSPMRGRQSFNPFKKFGFISLDGQNLKLTPFGKEFLSDKFDLAEIFFRAFIKWQLPDPDQEQEGYAIKPFIATLHLINKVNNLSIKINEKAKGISKEEFSLFGPTLVDYQDIDAHAKAIIEWRKKLKGKSSKEIKIINDEYKNSFAKNFLDSEDPEKIKVLLATLKDYGDNAIRYFHLTGFFHIRGNGFYIDLQERRSIEIQSLLAFDNAKPDKFTSKEAYINYISDISQPSLPWETRNKYTEIILLLLEEILESEKDLGLDKKEKVAYESFSDNELKNYITELRIYRKFLQNKKSHSLSQHVDKVKEYIEQLENIREADNKPLMLEKFSTLGLHALNDAIEIRPNYPVGDDNEPTFTAPSGKPDIECFYENFNAICEVTMLTTRDQWVNEGQPVMRHLRDFEERYTDKEAYCLFIAPTIHRDTFNTFKMAIKFEYEGTKQKIIPISIKNFTNILEILLELKGKNRSLLHLQLKQLYDELLQSAMEINIVQDWLDKIPLIIKSWNERLLV